MRKSLRTPLCIHKLLRHLCKRRWLLIASSVCLQSVVSSAQSLADITDERVVPVDYLGILILLFLFMVLDRLFYTLGLHVGKVMPCPALP